MWTQNVFGDAPAVHFRWAVVNAEGPHIGEDPRDDRFMRDTLAAEDLQAAVDHAPKRFGRNDLGDA
ncbi:hypothetical protein D9M71_819290 [compost metagenome]